MFKLFKNSNFNIRLRNLYDSNQAVVGIVVAVLLIGLVVTILSVIQLIYVPNWMEEIESEHIDEVFNQFCQLKLVIDTQSAINKTYTPIVTSINLGTNKIPFFMSTQAAGAIDIIPYYDDIQAGVVNISNSTLNINHPLGTIRFTSANAYYIPDQQISFIYENGALITNQTQGNSLNIKPSFRYEDIGSNGTVYFNVVNISGVGGKISKSGYDNEQIRIELNDYNNFTHIKNVNFLNITTNYKYIWKSFIRSTFNNKGFQEGTDYNFEDTDTSVDWNWISITFINKPDIELMYTNINAQIGPGWIDIE